MRYRAGLHYSDLYFNNANDNRAIACRSRVGGNLFSNSLDANPGGRVYSMCCEIPWRPKLPRTLLDVSLLLTVIGGYSDSNGIPAFASNTSPISPYPRLLPRILPSRPYIYISSLSHPPFDFLIHPGASTIRYAEIIRRPDQRGCQEEINSIFADRC